MRRSPRCKWRIGYLQAIWAVEARKTVQRILHTADRNDLLVVGASASPILARAVAGVPGHCAPLCGDRGRRARAPPPRRKRGQTGSPRAHVSRVAVWRGTMISLTFSDPCKK